MPASQFFGRTLVLTFTDTDPSVQGSVNRLHMKRRWKIDSQSSSSYCLDTLTPSGRESGKPVVISPSPSMERNQPARLIRP